MSYHVRAALTHDRKTRGPADGLLAEIQRDVLARHPDWKRRLVEVESAPLSIGYTFTHASLAGVRAMNAQRKSA